LDSTTSSPTTYTLPIQRNGVQWPTKTEPATTLESECAPSRAKSQLSLRMAPSWQQHTTTFSPVLADADTCEHHTAGGTRRTIKWVTLRVDARHPRPRNDMYLHAGGELVRRVIVDQGMTCIFTQAVGLCSMSSLDPQTKLAAPDGRSNGSRCEWTQGIHDDVLRGFAACMKVQQEWMHRWGGWHRKQPAVKGVPSTSTLIKLHRRAAQPARNQAQNECYICSMP
jgi:hypothetical protein